MALLLPDEPRPASAPPARAFALWNLGFRPFYLLAGLLAAFSVPLWTAQYAGWPGAGAYASGPLWHAHEMIFGYAFAVIVGFLFTAARSWTNRPTPSGPALVAIAALWVAARVLLLTPWTWLAAAADVAFAAAAAAGIGVPLATSRNRRNYFFVVILLGIGAANLWSYYALAGSTRFSAQSGLQIALDLILFVMTVMGGRVIPSFTMNAIRGARCQRRPTIEWTALGGVLALLVADLFALPSAIVGLIAAIAGAAHCLRLILWQPWVTWGRPILWILHVSYAWIVVHLALRALGAFDLTAQTLATHALTVGAIGGLTLGMMTRTARGHTGRPLLAGRTETACYALVQVAALARVAVPLVAPGLNVAAVIASGTLWGAAFAVFVALYWPILSRPRIDGQPG